MSSQAPPSALLAWACGLFSKSDRGLWKLQLFPPHRVRCRGQETAFFYMNLVLRKQKPFWNPHSLLQAGFPSVSWDRIWARSSARCSVGKGNGVTLTHSDVQHTAWAGGGWASSDAYVHLPGFCEEGAGQQEEWPPMAVSSQQVCLCFHRHLKGCLKYISSRSLLSAQYFNMDRAP